MAYDITVAATEAIIAINIHQANIFLALLLINKSPFLLFIFPYIIYHIFQTFSI